MRWWVAVALGLAVAWMALAAFAHEPGSPYASWYQELQHPALGKCCDDDCQPTDFRIVGDHYEVLIDERFVTPQLRAAGITIPAHWEAVPADRLLERHDNPTGGMVVCYYFSQGSVPRDDGSWETSKVRCAIRAVES